MLTRAHITTTASIEGWSIEQYCGPVAAHIVAGTGFFSDFTAGLTDVFGGRSGTYQKQLAALQSEVLDQLLQKAMRLGANWVLGVRVDFDEISGKGMQMFMVSALGTAVIARRPSVASDQSAHAEKAVPAAELRSGLQRRALVEKALAGKLEWTPETWAAVAEHRVDEAVPQALRYVEPWADAHVAKNHALEFFHALDPDALRERLHRALAGSPELEGIASGFIVTLGLVDLSWVLEHLAHTDFRLRRAALQLLRGDAGSYTLAHLDLMQRISEVLKSAFPECVEMIDKKSMFSRSTEPHWRCSCGRLFPLSAVRCDVCLKDRRGLLHHDFKPEDAQARILLQVDFLRGVLGAAEAGTLPATVPGSQP